VFIYSLALTGRRKVFVDVDERFRVHLAELTHLVHSKFKLVPVHLIMVAVRCGVVGAPGIRYQESGMSNIAALFVLLPQKKKKKRSYIATGIRYQVTSGIGIRYQVSGVRCTLIPVRLSENLLRFVPADLAGHEFQPLEHLGEFCIKFSKVIAPVCLLYQVTI
jgi:hypothetical protein